MEVTEQILDFLEKVSKEGVPAGIESRAQACVADALHAILLAVDSETAKILWRYLEPELPRGGCSILGRGLTGPETAALYHGSLAAGEEIDDVHYDTSLHSGAVIVPAALAAAEYAGADRKRFLTAVAAGYEVNVRLSRAAGNRHYYFFHSSGTAGAVGAAAAAGVAMGLDRKRMGNAIGIAATSASGLWQGITQEAVMMKHLHLGMAAERGVRSARLAALDWPGAAEALEGSKGFLAALARTGDHAPGEDADPNRLQRILTENLGTAWAIQRNIYKRYAFCLGVAEPLEGLREILREGIDPEKIDSLLVEASYSVVWLVGNPAPKDVCQARFSAPFALSLLLTGRDPEAVPLHLDWLAQPDVQRWLPRIALAGRDSIGSRRAVVTATLSDGRRIVKDAPLRNLSEEEVYRRFRRVATERIGEEGIRLAEAVSGLTQSKDLSELSKRLTNCRL